MKKFASVLLAAVLLLSCLTGCGSDENTVTVASKQFTESILLGEMYAQLIEAHTDLKVERKLNLGGTSVCMPAMQNGEIDIYFEYTGTAYNEILDQELLPGMTADEILEAARTGLAEQENVTMFDPLGLNNTFALAMKTDRMEELGVETVSDLAPVSGDLTFGANHVFYTRVHDGYDGLVATYGLNFADALRMDSSLLYEAADAGELDVIIVYATDALLRRYDMTCLVDDQALFPPYHGAPVCRNEVLEAHPELSDVLNTLAGAVDDTAIQELNYQVDVEQRAVEDVAREFLTENGYI